MESTIDKVRAFIGEHALIDAGSAVVVGLSGGVDSIVLAEMLHRLEFDVTALHVNYRLRGRESDEDERFVRSFCQKRGLELFVESFDTEAVAKQRGTSIQETARDLRYEVLDRCAREAGVRHAAVAHHRDDQAETVLLNLFRGTGPEGLAGMRLSRPVFDDSGVRLVRPLLCLRRREIEEYAKGRGLAWREDASNAKPAYRRSALRGHVVPAIEAHFGAAATENIVRSAELVRAYVDGQLLVDVRSAFAAAATHDERTSSDDCAAADEATETSDEASACAVMASSGEMATPTGQLDVAVLRHLEPALRGRVVLEAIRRWLPRLGATRAVVDEIESLLDSQPGRRLVHPSGVIWRERDRLLFMANRSEGEEAGSQPGAAGRNGIHPQENYTTALEDRTLVLKEDHPVTTTDGVVEVALNVPPPENVMQVPSNEEYVDADRLAEPLTVRRWRPGDRFTPLGMSRPKKVSDFLTDEKVPPHRRAEVLVVQAKDEIVWVVGYRISDAARLRQDTRRIARLRFHPAKNTSIKSA